VKNHTHSFDSLCAELLRDPEHIEIITEYGEYSEQQIRMIYAIKQAAKFVETYNKPIQITQLRENIAER